jgi:hypothetical protein
MNREAGSPLKDRIKVLGVATPGKREETITQAAFVDRLLKLITQEQMRDRDLLKRGKAVDPTPDNLRWTLIFRDMFREERDEDIALTLWNFFGAAQRRWPYAWNTVERGNILNRTTGFAALMRFLPVAYREHGIPNSVPSIGFFENLFSRIELRDSDFTPEQFKPGSSGEALLARTLIEQASAKPKIGA